MLSFRGTSIIARVMTLALLTACSGGNIAGPTGGGAIAPAAIGTETASLLSTHGTGVAAHSFIDFAAMAKNKGPTIAISVREQNVVDLLTAAGKLVGQLTGFENPTGLASDIKGDLYVADADLGVLIYAAGFASPPTTLSNPGQVPFGVDSFGNGAYVAVANSESASNGPGSVSIFKGTTLQRTITYSHLRYADYCAFDGDGNLYVDGEDAKSKPLLGEIRHATSGGSTFEPLTTTNSIGFVYGLQVTTAGQIAIEDGENHTIYTYNPPSGGSLGTPTQITPLGLEISPTAFAFTKDMTGLYAPVRSYDAAYRFAYPTGGTPLSSFKIGAKNDDFYGITLIPTQYPGSSR